MTAPRGRDWPMAAPLGEREVLVETTDGQMNTLVVHPQGAGPFPVVLFYMDGAGRREELSEMARRIAAAGYYVVLPNLYYRRRSEFQMRWNEDGVWEMLELMWSLTTASVLEDSAALLRHIDTDVVAARDRIGTLGYCMGAPFAIAVAARHPDRVRCVASIHGSQLVTDRDDSPHHLVDQVKGELYFACAEDDEWATRATIDTLVSALERCAARSRIEWYPGTRHGFVFPQRQDTYDPTSAERHWDRLWDLFARRLG